MQNHSILHEDLHELQQWSWRRLIPLSPLSSIEVRKAHRELYVFTLVNYKMFCAFLISLYAWDMAPLKDALRYCYFIENKKEARLGCCQSW